MPSAKVQFENDAPQLREQMTAAPSTGEALQVVLSYLRELSSPDGTYVPQLTIAQSRVVLDMLGHLRRLLSGNREFAGEADAVPTKDEISAAGEHSPLRLPKVKTLIGISAAGLAGGLASSGLLAVVLAISVGVAATLVAAEVLDRNAPSSLGAEVSSAESRRSAALTEIYDRLLSLIASFLESLDAIVAELAPGIEAAVTEPPPAPALESHVSVVLYLQRLAAAAHANEGIPLALQELLGQDLSDLLSEFGLSLDVDFERHPERFDHRKAGAGNALKQARLIRPAIVKGDVTVLRGQAMEP